jgi:phosphopantothenate---cysteine ligase (CTP)
MKNNKPKILITSGGTKIPIDDVRHIGNMSTGRLGSSLALEFLKVGFEVDFLYAIGSHNPSQLNLDLQDADFQSKYEEFLSRKPYLSRLTSYSYKTYDDYSATLIKLLDHNPAITILAAAVSDYGVTPVKGKLVSTNNTTLQLHPLPKLISKVKTLAPSTQLVGFKLLSGVSTEELINAAKHSLVTNHCSMVVSNDLSTIKSGAHRLNVVLPTEIISLEEPLAPRLCKLNN